MEASGWRIFFRISTEAGARTSLPIKLREAVRRSIDVHTRDKLIDDRGREILTHMTPELLDDKKRNPNNFQSGLLGH